MEPRGQSRLHAQRLGLPHSSGRAPPAEARKPAKWYQGAPGPREPGRNQKRCIPEPPSFRSGEVALAGTPSASGGNSTAWCKVLPLAPPPAIIILRYGPAGNLAEVEWVLGPLFSLVRSYGITEALFLRVSCARVDPALPIPVATARGNVSYGRRFPRALVASPLRYPALGDPLEPTGCRRVERATSVGGLVGARSPVTGHTPTVNAVMRPSVWVSATLRMVSSHHARDGWAGPPEGVWAPANDGALARVVVDTLRNATAVNRARFYPCGRQPTRVRSPSPVVTRCRLCR